MTNYSNDTYGRKVVKAAIKDVDFFKKKLLQSWVVCILIGILVGCLGTVGVVLLTKDKTEKRIDATVTQIPTPTPVVPTYIESPFYGTIDGRVFVDEISMDWSSGAELGFVPLDVPMNEELQEFIYCLSYGYNIEFPFVMALIELESSFVPNAIGKTNDYGLMQINTCNHEWLSEKLGITDFLDPHQNIRSGMYILRYLFEKYEDPAKVLMAYNMGETGAARLWEQGIFETNYSKRIMKTAAEYTQQISERGETK